MSRMIIFDDGRGQLGPMTDLRAAFEVRTGVFTTAGRIRNARPKTLGGYWVPEPMQPLVAARADAPVNDLPDEELLLCVNGRWARPDAELDLAPDCALLESGTEHVVAAHLPRAHAEYFLRTGELHERTRVRTEHRRVLYRYPWEVLALAPETITGDILSHRMADALVPTDVATVIGDHPVEVHASAAIGPNVVFDASTGPILVEARAVIRPGAILCGPCAIGAGATVVDRAHIKANTVLGARCKVGGEVGGTIFQGYANKSHEGHLGDSWVGKWVNFGAGTMNSNLLNTYGEVSMRAEPDGPRHRTGRAFLGAIVGDHVKTAIGTRIMTGSVFGTGAMIAVSGHAPTSVRRFAWLTDDGERVYRCEKFLAVMHTVMGRRDREPGATYQEAVRDLHRRWTETRADA